MRSLAFVCTALIGCSAPEGSISAIPDSDTDAEAEADAEAETVADTETVTDTAPPPLDRSKCVADPDKKGLTTRAVPGKTAKYLSYVPATYDPSKATSLLIALHGAGDVATNYIKVWTGAADARGFIVIAPDGSCAVGPGNTWCGGDGQAIADSFADVGHCYSIDPKRRIIDGFSAGGVIAYGMGLEGATYFAGISISAADLGTAEAIAGKRLLPAPWKIPVSQHHGTADMNFPIAGARAGRDRLLAAGHMVYWHEFDGGHTTTPAFALVRWDDLASSRAP